MSDEYIVAPSDDRDRRILFSGTEADARAYVVSNFPAVHIEPGRNRDPGPDVVVISPDGSKAGYVGGAWDDEHDDVTWTEEPVQAPDETVQELTSDVDDVKTRVADLEAKVAELTAPTSAAQNPTVDPSPVSETGAPDTTTGDDASDTTTGDDAPEHAEEVK